MKCKNQEQLPFFKNYLEENNLTLLDTEGGGGISIKKTEFVIVDLISGANKNSCVFLEGNNYYIVVGFEGFGSGGA